MGAPGEGRRWSRGDAHSGIRRTPPPVERAVAEHGEESMHHGLSTRLMLSALQKVIVSPHRKGRRMRAIWLRHLSPCGPPGLMQLIWLVVSVKTHRYIHCAPR